MIRRIVSLLVVAGIACAFIATLWSFFKKGEASPAYQTERPFQGDIVKLAVATGALVPRREIALKPRVSGVIEKLFVEPGQHIAAQTPIARIRIVPNLVELSRAESEVRAARIRFLSLQSQSANVERLHEANLMTEREFNEQRMNLAINQEQLETAESNLELVRDGASARIGKASNVVAATIGGTVLEVLVQEGGSVIEANNFNEGTTIATIADMRDMVFVGRVDQSDVGQLELGMPVVMTVGPLGAQELTGKLEYLSPKGKLVDGAIAFEVRASVELRPGMLLRANYSANAHIVLGRRERVLALAERLVSYESGKAFVDIVSDRGACERREVYLGLSDGISVEVSSGVLADDQLKVPQVSPDLPAQACGPGLERR